MNKKNFENAFNANIDELGPSEKSLSETGASYVILHLEDDECTRMGVALVKLEEGILQIPYNNVLMEDGYEQFELERSEMLSPSEVENLRLLAEEKHREKMRAFDEVRL